MSLTARLKEVQSVITSLLTGEPDDGIEIVRLDGLYRELEDQRIPFWTFGYSSLNEFLRTIPGIEIRPRFGRDLIYFAGKESTEHVKKLVARQRSKTGSNRSRSYSKRIPPQYHSQLRRPSPSRQYDPISEEILNIVQKHPRGLLRSVLHRIYTSSHPDSNFDHKQLVNHLNILQTEVMVRDNMVFPMRNTRSVRTSTPRSHSVPVHHTNDIYDWNNGRNVGASGTIAKSYRVTPDSDNENNCDHAEDNFEFVTCAKKVDAKLDECNTIDAIPKTTASDFIGKSVLKRSEHSLEKKESALNTVMENFCEMQLEETKKDEDETILLESQDCMARLNARVQFRLEKLIQNNPDGIRCIDLPNKYREEYGVLLDWESLGFHRISNFAAHLPHIFHVVGPSADGEYYLHNAKEPLPTDPARDNKKQKLTDANLYKIYDSDDDGIEAVPSNISLGFSNQIFPDDVMTNGESVGQISVTQFKVFTNELDEDRSLVAVRVVESFSPSFFWIHIEKKRRKFEDMMNSLQNFYETRKAEYIVPIFMLEKGLNVACMFFGKWHRAIIKAVDPQCQVTLLFYDYGTVKSYPADQIYHLHRSFSSLPAQAIPCGLYNVRPFDGDVWPKNVIDWFIRRVHDRVMWMIIGKIDTETNSMVISLTDTSGVYDFHVSDKMFEKKMAMRGNMDIIDPEDLSNYVEDYGEGPQVSDESAIRQTEPVDNVLKLPPGITSVTVENLCCGLSILEKKQSVIMTTRDSIDSLQNSIQKILLGYSRMLLTMHAAIDLNKLTNVTDDLAKTIIDEFHSTLTTVQMNPTVDTSGTESFSAAQQLCHDSHELKTNSRSENPSQCSSSESDSYLEVQLNNDTMNDINNIPESSDILDTPVTIEKSEATQEIGVDLLSDGKNSCIGVNGEKNIAKITELKHLDKDKKGKSRSKLEMSITNTCRNFLQRHESNVIFDHSPAGEKFDSLVNYLNDTNPFKEDLMRINSKENLQIPPPLPPRFNQRIEDDSVETMLNFIPQETVKIVYRASPVMYDLSKTDTLFETTHKSHAISFSSTELNHNEGWKRVNLSVEDDDRGYQSDASSPILKCSIPQQDKQVMRVSEAISYQGSRMNNIGLIKDDNYIANRLSMERDFILVQLSCNIACIFHINGEGWIPVREFLSIFTPFFETCDFYQFVDMALPKTAILILKRVENSGLLDRYERTMSNLIASYQFNQRRRSFGKLEDLALIQLSSIIKILNKMSIITKEEIGHQRKQDGLPDYGPSQAMADVIKLISTYGSTYGCN